MGEKHRTIAFNAIILGVAYKSLFCCISSIEALFSSTKGQEEAERVLQSGDSPLGSGGPLQEWYADPELQGDPENQRQQARKIGAG